MILNSCIGFLFMLMSLTPCSFGREDFSKLDKIVLTGGLWIPYKILKPVVEPTAYGIHELFQKIRAKSETRNEEDVQKFAEKVTGEILNSESKKTFTTSHVEGTWKPHLGASTSQIAMDNSTLIYHILNVSLTVHAKLKNKENHNLFLQLMTNKVRENPSVEFSLIAEFNAASICVKFGEKKTFAPRKINCKSTTEVNNARLLMPSSSSGSVISNYTELQNEIVGNLQSEISSYIDRSWYQLLIAPTSLKAEGKVWKMSSLGELLRAAWVHEYLPATSPTEQEEALRKKMRQHMENFYARQQ